MSLADQLAFIAAVCIVAGAIGIGACLGDLAGQIFSEWFF